MAMDAYRVKFDELEWQVPIPGIRFKAFQTGGKQLRLAEFTAEFIELEWCVKGHAGWVLAGELEIDFHGQKVIFKEGDGLLIPPGTVHGHKARSLSPAVTLLLVEDL